MKFSALLFISMLSLMASASTEFGNGGNAVICGEQVLMYDSIEAVLRYNIPPVVPKESYQTCRTSLSNSQICDYGSRAAKLVASRLKNLDPELEAILQKHIDSFWSETKFVQGDLLPVDDTGLGFVYENCTMKQLAIQHKPVFTEDSYYFISQSLWQNMEGDNQASLILHEVIYRHALDLNSTLNSSERVRYFNALILSDKISTLSPDQYSKIKSEVFR